MGKAEQAKFNMAVFFLRIVGFRPISFFRIERKFGGIGWVGKVM